MSPVPIAKLNAVTAHTRWDEGLVVCGNAFSSGVRKLIDRRFGANEEHARFPLIIVDPPYGIKLKGVVWDDVAEYKKWMAHCVERARPNATICMWGGVGKPRDRPFLKWVSTVEDDYPEWRGQFVTWSKKRAYGTADKYLFTREEVFILTRGKPTFNIPLLEIERGYAGFSEKYKAKSKFLRRTLVWRDITELFSGKIHPAQKPDKLYEVLVNTHSKEGDVVYDPCAGSGTTARACINTGRHFVIIEEDRSYLDKAKLL
jgi:site-specific DNA-methyltransferase (adenine-specific)